MKHSPEYLLQMARQIAANQPRHFDDETNAERVASHLRRFWAPSMLESLRTVSKEELGPVLTKSLALLGGR